MWSGHISELVGLQRASLDRDAPAQDFTAALLGLAIECLGDLDGQQVEVRALFFILVERVKSEVLPPAARVGIDRVYDYRASGGVRVELHCRRQHVCDKCRAHPASAVVAIDGQAPE